VSKPDPFFFALKTVFVVYRYMIRKCVYTGVEAEAKETVLPKKALEQGEKHNWASYVPVSLRYKEFKKDRPPTDLEFSAYETFFMLEMARMNVLCLEEKLAKTQAQIRKTLPEVNKRVVSRKKEKEIKQAVQEKKAVQASDKGMKEILDKKKNLWE